MSESLYRLLSLDAPAVLTALFAGISCSLLGNFLVLRRMSLMGDAISHAVLPGIVIAFLLSGTRSGAPVFIGAAAAGVLTAVLVEILRKVGKLETGTAMGVVFSILFALGVLLIEQAAARTVDLDADCLLHGQLESIFWFPPHELVSFFQISTLSLLPSEVIRSFLVMLACVGFVCLLYKELALAAFDPALATALGFNSRALHYLLMVFVASAVVASFEAVGSILVIAMIICPAATARLLTDRLRTQLLISVLVAILAIVSGYIGGAFLPLWLGWENSLSGAGMIAVMSGVILGLAVIAAPRYGVIARRMHQVRIAVQVAREDILGLLYRVVELGELAKGQELSQSDVCLAVGGGKTAKRALSKAFLRGEVASGERALKLTEQGLATAKSLVRTHRLWESYLVERLGLRSDHVHERATELEHFTTSPLQERLAEVLEKPATDPHGKPIPE